MKYLKLFNESIDKENLTDLCDMCLAYLMDDGYEYEIQEFSWLDFKVIYFDNNNLENKSYYFLYPVIFIIFTNLSYCRCE